MNPRLARMAAWVVALALIAAPIIAVLNGWLADDRWPIRRLVVQGRFVQIDESDVRAAVAPAVHGGFFAVELADVKRAVEALPWVERAEVRKQWPDRIDVRVDERVPIAFFGSDRLLSQHGEVFVAPMNQVSNDLPQLDGPDGRADEVWTAHQRASAALKRIGVEIAATRMNERGAWTLTAADGAVFVLGREQMDARLQRFVAAMSRLREDERRRIERADLRFANGFSVTWRAPVTPTLSPESNDVAEPTAGGNHEPQA